MPSKRTPKEETPQQLVLPGLEDDMASSGAVLATDLPQEIGEAKEALKPYTTEQWKPGVQVYRCLICRLDLMLEDDMIQHVIDHFPAQQREAILENLIQQKEK